MYKYIFKLLLVLIVAFTSQMPTVTFAGNVSEYKIKAAFIYNFSRFTQWPDDGSELIICIHGKDPFGSYIDSLSGKKAGEKTIKVIRTQLIDEVRSCHIVFLNIIPTEQRLFEQALNKIKDTNVLTIADVENAVRFGVMVGLVIKEDKVGFELNHTAAKASGLKISAKLLMLAKEVI